MRHIYPLMILITLGAFTGEALAHLYAGTCVSRKFRCEQRCNDDTRGGSLERMRCYERCWEDENYCRQNGKHN